MAILNLPKSIWNLRTVNDWATYNMQPYSTPQYAFQRCIELATQTQTEPTIKYFFTDIWIPVKKMYTDQNVQLTPEQFLAAEYVWANIGLTPVQISDAYQTLYGMNYLSVPAFSDDLGYSSVSELSSRMRAIFNLNKGKYLKLLDLQGLSYNPLWNVDGTEIRQTLENEGVNDVSSKAFASDHGGTSDDVKRSHNVAPYDGDGTASKLEWEEETKGGNNALDSIPQYGYDSTTDQWITSAGSLQNLSGETMSASGSRNETTYTHNNAENGITDTTYGTDYVVQAVDTAFGQMLVGGDKMHVEKYIRQGNIGVTKSTELIEAEREILRFSVLKEFFDDLNEQLLVGIY